VISWLATPNTRGAAVTGYEIKVITYLSTYEPYVATCDMTANLALTCTIAMNDLTNVLGLHRLTHGTIVKATVSAINSVGTAPASNPNGAGAVVFTVPNAPTLARGPSTSQSVIEVVWNSITSAPSNGEYAVSGYMVYSNGGSGSVFSVFYDGTGDSVTLTARQTTGVTPGATYLI
jgi:hypothetical protein